MRYNKRHLARNESTRFPSNIVVFDSETNPNDFRGEESRKIHRLMLWCATGFRLVNGKQTRITSASGTTCEEFWEFVRSRIDARRPLYMFAHNLGFDLTVLRFWRELEEQRLTITQPSNWRGKDAKGGDKKDRNGILVITDPPTIVECWDTKSRARVVLLDTMNYWRCQLADLGHDLGVEKLPMPGDAAELWEWKKYCRNDVLILEAAVMTLDRFVRENDAGVFKYTVGSQAMASFKHRHMKHSISIHREEEPLKLERESYRGGEVRMGYCGIVSCRGLPLYPLASYPDRDGKPVRRGPIYCYDCQSFYPSVMLHNLFPVELMGTVHRPKEDDLDWLLDNRFCIAECTIKTLDCAYPIKRDGEVIMGVGAFNTVLCGPELRRAVQQKHAIHVGYLCYYRQEPIFASFVREWYKRRLAYRREGKAEMEAMTKTLMNSLFGKFGQRKELWSDYDELVSPFPWGTFLNWDRETNDYDWFRSICWRTQRRNDAGESAESFPAIAAAVTSYGRERMRQLRGIAGNDSFLYQDTDSLHVLLPGALRLAKAGVIRKGQMGMLAFKGKFEEGEYRGIKDYTLDDTHVIAGIKKNATDCGGGVYKQTEFQRLGAILQTSPIDGVLVSEVYVPRSNSLPTGRVLPDGTVLPPVLNW